jgi:hypothetical protein
LSSTPRPTARAEKIAVALIVAASFALFSIYSLATPLFEASDELWHYPLVQRLASDGGLPIQRQDQTDADAPWRQEGSQPPLYYAVAALATSPIDSSNFREIRRLNPHSDMGVPTRDGNANAILHTPAEVFPWTRATLAVRIARLVSIVMSTITVFFTYLAARELFGRLEIGDWRLDAQSPISNLQSQTLLRLATPIFVAFTPMFAFISGSVNNDNAAILFSTIGLWWALRLMRLSDLSIRNAIVAGLITGLGALSKSSALGLVGLFGFAALLTRTKNQEPRTKIAQSWFLALGSFVSVLLAVTLLISGWWFIRNQQLYGDLLGWNAFLDVVGRREPPASLAQLWTEREGFVWAYWGIFGTLNLIMPPIVYDVLNGLTLLAVFGLVLRIAYSVSGKEPFTQYAIRNTLLCGVWVLLTFVSFLRWTSLTPASQGRLLFPCIAVFAAAMAYGLWRIHRVVLWIGCAIMIFIGVAAPFLFIAPAYTRPSSQWVERLPQPIDAKFGNALELVEAGSAAAVASPGDEVTLKMNWKLDQPLAKNYSVFVHLIDENDVIVAQRDMYPGQGTLATSELSPGFMWSDRYTLRIPRLAAAPKKLRWAVGIYDLPTGERLRLTNGDDRVIFGELDLTSLKDLSGLLRYDNGIDLLGYSLEPQTLAPGETLTVTTHWQANRPVDRDYSVSLQLLDDNANKIAQQDLTLPTANWKPGDVIQTTHALSVSNDAPPGVYRLLLVVYAPDDFARIGAYDYRSQYAGDQIELTWMRAR